MFRLCRARYLLWGAIAVVTAMLIGCGAKGDLYLPSKTEQSQG